MKVVRLDIGRLAIPFHAPFRHAAAERSETDSVWVEARSRSDAIGHGEACPRAYVTGEDRRSVAAFFARHRDELMARISELGDLIDWSAAHRCEIDRNPAAWCAIELALLDLLAAERGDSVEALLDLPELGGGFRYSAVVGADDGATFRRTVDRYRVFGFTDFKLKLSGDLSRDRDNLAWFQQHAPPDVRVRFDANNLWPTVAAAARYLDGVRCPAFAVEEPLHAYQYEALAELAATSGARIILDESCVRVEHVEALADLGTDWIINVRVSKMGGIVRSLGVVQTARRHGIPVIVGAQVGETSLLTRAALTIASAARDLLIAQEGAFGTLLLTTDVCEPSLMFGPGGALTVPAPSAPGFGLAVTEELSTLAAL